MANVKLRTVTVDDEPLARERLRALLGRHDDVEIVAECASGAEAVEAIQQKEPDVVFLDVQMPEMDGFRVLDVLGPIRGFEVIFLTAHDEHAVRAFDTRAVDYLLKPVSAARLAEAIDRVRGRTRDGRPARRLVVRDGTQIVFVPVEEIEWIESAGNYAIVHREGRTHIVRETMAALEGFLAGEGFLRLNRGAVVNLAKVQELRSADGRASAVLQSGAEVALTRSLRDVEARFRGEKQK